MKSAEEFFKRLDTDNEFAKKIYEALKEKKEQGSTNYYETFNQIANENGYELTREAVDCYLENNNSDEEHSDDNDEESFLCMMAALNTINTIF